MFRIRRVAFTGMLLLNTTFVPVQAQTDSTLYKNSEQTQEIKTDLEPDQKKKRQNKTEKLVFVSCLFIVLTTILLYNVRSK